MSIENIAKTLKNMINIYIMDIYVYNICKNIKRLFIATFKE